MGEDEREQIEGGPISWELYIWTNSMRGTWRDMDSERGGGGLILIPERTERFLSRQTRRSDALAQCGALLICGQVTLNFLVKVCVFAPMRCQSCCPTGWEEFCC